MIYKLEWTLEINQQEMLVRKILDYLGQRLILSLVLMISPFIKHRQLDSLQIILYQFKTQSLNLLLSTILLTLTKTIRNNLKLSICWLLLQEIHQRKTGWTLDLDLYQERENTVSHQLHKYCHTNNHSHHWERNL